MSKKVRYNLKVSEDGSLRLPPELAARLGLTPGTDFTLKAGAHSLELLRPVSHLAKVYIEVTNTCSLGCRTCMRNVWDEPPGWMAESTFQRVIQGIRHLQPLPSVFFGGFGEPLSHPGLVSMIRQVKALGAKAELISNGVLLTEALARDLLKAGLDTLWVSLDGATAQSYSDVRLGAQLPAIIHNLKRLGALQEALYLDKPQLGIAFVAMKRNIGDLPELLRLGERLGAAYFSISNLLAHTKELKQEVLYNHALSAGASRSSPGIPTVYLPSIDMEPEALQALGSILDGRYQVELAGGEIGQNVCRCPFISQGSTSIRWDGGISPCLPLLHSHQTYLGDRLRRSQEYFTGSILDKDLLDVWIDLGYASLRERLQNFDFSQIGRAHV